RRTAGTPERPTTPAHPALNASPLAQGGTPPTSAVPSVVHRTSAGSIGGGVWRNGLDGSSCLRPPTLARVGEGSSSFALCGRRNLPEPRVRADGNLLVAASAVSHSLDAGM